jgi:hypothetical protein
MATVTLTLTKWNAEKLLARSTQILEDFAPIIAAEARTQITTVKWSWPTSTLRFRSLNQGGRQVSGTTKAGRPWSGVVIPPGSRDIVDRGGLLNSQQAPQVSKNVLTIAWTAPYARTVLGGGDYGSYVNPAGNPVEVGQRPPRNWIEGAFQAQPPRRFFVARWKELAQ